MLTELNKYSGVYAKVRVLQRSLLTDEDYAQLLAKRSVPQLAAYLKEHPGYRRTLAEVRESDIHRGQLERLLLQSTEQEFVRLLHFLEGQEKRFLQIYITGYEIELIKKLLRKLKGGQGAELSPSVCYRRYLTIVPERLLQAQTVSAFLEALTGTPYHLILSSMENRDGPEGLFQAEMALDVYYYKKAWNEAQKLADKQFVRHTLGTEIDMLNLLWVMRCKRYFHMPNELIYTFVIPVHYRLKKQQLVALVECGTPEQQMELVRRTKYAGILGEEYPYPEQYYRYRAMETMKRQALKHPFSIMTVLGYLHRKESEISNLIKVIEGIRYQIDPRQIEAFLIRKEGNRFGR